MTVLASRTHELQRLRAALAAPTARPALVELPMANFLMVDGEGPPEQPDFRNAVEALFNLSYGLRFWDRAARATAQRQMPLEVLWSTADAEDWDPLRRDRWAWTAMIAQPPEVSPALVRTVAARLQLEQPLRALRRVRLAAMAEGLCAQITHVGPYRAEAPTIAVLHVFIEQEGYRRFGPHHEIYLGDPRRTTDERLRTILRQPIRRAD